MRFTVCLSIQEKLVGITTDGEAANTGKNNGLWKLLQDECGKEILTMWCCAHRSDLAIEEMMSSVDELRIWKAALIGVASYFRVSKCKTKLLKDFCPDARPYPRHHEVRFAQHTLQLIDVVLHNMDGAREVWRRMSETGTKKEKSEAKGFLKTWSPRQVWVTKLMGDIIEVFQDLQKQLQRGDLLITDVLTCRETAKRKMEVLATKPYPGKRESTAWTSGSLPTFENHEDGRSVRATHNACVTIPN